MNKKMLGVIILGILNSFLCFAEETGVIVTMVSKKEEFQIGERVVLQMEIENNTSNSIFFCIGYGKENSFVFSTEKCPVGSGPQLYPYYEFGGYALNRQLDSKEKFPRSVVLNKYLDFSKMGHYEIKCTLTFDIKNKAGEKEVFKKEFSIEFDIVKKAESITNDESIKKDKQSASDEKKTELPEQ